MTIDKKTHKAILKFQQEEINGHHIYKYIARIEKNKKNKEIFEKMSADELMHYKIYKRYTNHDIKPSELKIVFFKFLARFLGPTFAIKLLENNEIKAQSSYAEIIAFPEVKQIIEDEENHERKLIDMIDEDRLNYLGSVVLGLNDALVELTGALAGLTLALRDPSLIALTGSVTGIAAAFSMAASEYLSTKTEDSNKGALKASIYTGITYLFTVIVLIIPFIFLNRVFISLALTLTGAVAIIALFNYYYSVVKDEKFIRRFSEMISLSFGVALLSFGVGFILRRFFGVDV